MSAIAHCAVIRNPFSTAVAHAKIPDGAVSLSSSGRYSISTTAVSASGFIEILLVGGFFTPIAIRTSKADANGAKTYTYSHPQFQVPNRITVASGNTYTQNASVANQYRIVSQGVRVSLINNSQDNDGWFEAIRCTPSNSYDNWGYSDAAGEVSIVPVLSQYEGGILDDNQVNWAMNPSYIAGKARDLYKHNFVLHRQENNDFIEIPSVSTIQTASSAIQTSTKPFTNANEMDPWWVDKQMDSVLIRIRGNTAGAANGQMVIHLHIVQHVEECYDEKSNLHRFMTTCPRGLSMFNATMSAMKRDIKPSIIRSPTMPVSSTGYSDYKKRRRIVRRRRR